MVSASSAVLAMVERVSTTSSRVSSATPSAARAETQSISSAMPGGLSSSSSRARPTNSAVDRITGEQLPLIVPFVQRLVDGEPLVALQPDQRRIERARQRLGRRGLAHAGLTLQQQRLPEGQGEVQSHRHAVVDEVAGLVELLAQRQRILGKVAHAAANRFRQEVLQTQC